MAAELSEPAGTERAPRQPRLRVLAKQFGVQLRTGGRGAPFKTGPELQQELSELIAGRLRQLKKRDEGTVRPQVAERFPCFAWLTSTVFGKLSGTPAPERRERMLTEGKMTCAACVATTSGSKKGGLLHDDGPTCFLQAEWSKEKITAASDGGARAAKRRRVAAASAPGDDGHLARLMYDLRCLPKDDLLRIRDFADSLAQESCQTGFPLGDEDFLFPPLDLLGGRFHPRADVYNRAPEAVTVNFVPRSPMVFEPGALSARAGAPAWFSFSSFHERCRTMVEFFQRRDAFDNLRGIEKQLATADLACYKCVNPGRRRAAKATGWIYAFYRQKVAKLLETPEAHRADVVAEFLVNVVLVRNTLSVHVRDALADGTFVWLSLRQGQIANMADLDAFFARTGGHIFGAFVNPMRRRAEQPKHGYCDLCQDLHLWSAAAGRLTQQFLKSLDVGALLRDMRLIPGFGGSGFRSKEILCDFVEHADLFLPETDLQTVQTDYRGVLVIGVGPCRTVNYLFNLPFLLNEQMAADPKNALYMPAIKVVIAYLRQTWPDLYADRTDLDICYELCEHSKNLFCWYADVGRKYRPTHYGKAPPEQFSPGEITALRLANERCPCAAERARLAKARGTRVAWEEGDDDLMGAA